jgi:hypothetical protein
MQANVLANRKRAHLNELLKEYPGTIIYEDYIRLEQRIDDQKSLYSFDPRTAMLKDINFRVNQKGVADNDVFVVTDLSMFIDCRPIEKQSAAVLQTYPNAIAFANSNCNPEDLEVFYNGQLTFKVGATIYINSDTTRKFRSVPQTQQDTTATTLFSQSANDLDFVAIEPTVILSGKQDSKINLNFNYFPKIDVAAKAGEGEELEFENVLTVEARGFTVYNAADGFLEKLAALRRG